MLFSKNYLVLIIFLFIGCVSTSFSRTGNIFPPLAEDAHVDVIMRAAPDYKVQQIGIVNLQGGDLEAQIEEAKIIARENGGDVIILSEVGRGRGRYDDFDIRTFEISKKILEK